MEKGAMISGWGITESSWGHLFWDRPWGIDRISGGKTDKNVYQGGTCRHQNRQEHEDRIYLVYNNWDKFSGNRGYEEKKWSKKDKLGTFVLKHTESESNTIKTWKVNYWWLRCMVVLNWRWFCPPGTLLNIWIHYWLSQLHEKREKNLVDRIHDAATTKKASYNKEFSVPVCQWCWGWGNVKWNKREVDGLKGKQELMHHWKGPGERKKDLTKIVAVKIEKGRRLNQIFRGRIRKNLPVNCLWWGRRKE